MLIYMEVCLVLFGRFCLAQNFIFINSFIWHTILEL